MTDKFLVFQDSGDETGQPPLNVAGIVQRYVDNGDGTYYPFTAGGGGAGGPATIANGADVAEGNTADAANTTGTTGTISGKLRGIVQLLAHGSATSANSVPVVIASDQAAVASSVADGSNVTQGAIADAAVTTNTTGTISGKLRGLVALLASVIGTAGSASTSVLTVQGVASGQTVIVDENAARRGTLTDRSGTITSGGTAQQLAASNASRKYLLIKNPLAATEVLWVNFTTTAVASQPSIDLNPGDSIIFEAGYVTTELVSVIAATTAHAFIAKEG